MDVFFVIYFLWFDVGEGLFCNGVVIEVDVSVLVILICFLWVFVKLGELVEVGVKYGL